MDTIFNFGDPHKDFAPIAKNLLGDYKIKSIPVTNNKAFYNDQIMVIDAAYGFGMVWDSLNMMKRTGMLNRQDNLVFLGSMGSFSSDISLDDLVIPSRVYYPDLGRKIEVVVPDQLLLAELKSVLRHDNRKFQTYDHGSVNAVFDPTNDPEKYLNTFYGDLIQGVDCSEAYAGLKFCEENGLHGVVLLYCSDDPINHISDIPTDEFNRRAAQRDLEMHDIAKKVIMKVRAADSKI